MGDMVVSLVRAYLGLGLKMLALERVCIGWTGAVGAAAIDGEEIGADGETNGGEVTGLIEGEA